MNSKVEVQEPTPDSEFASGVLEMAKKFVEEGGAEPMLFIDSDRQSETTIIQVSEEFGDFDDPKVRWRLGEALRQMAANPWNKVTSIALLSEVWFNTVVDEEAFERSGLDFEQWHSWSKADKDRHILRREALMVNVQTCGARDEHVLPVLPARAWKADNVARAGGAAGRTSSAADRESLQPLSEDDMIKPHGVGFRIKSLWAYLAIHEDNDEGIMALPSPNGWVPAIAADETRLRDLRQGIEAVARKAGIRVNLVRFDQRTEVETVFEPGS